MHMSGRGPQLTVTYTKVCVFEAFLVFEIWCLKFKNRYGYFA